MLKPVSILIPFKCYGDDYLLWTQKRESNDCLRGLWEFPGGKVELGETPLAAVVREVCEEVGVKVVAPQFFSSFAFDKGLLIYVYLYEDSLDTFPDQGYRGLAQYVGTPDQIPPNNQKILFELNKYFQCFRWS